MSFLINPNNFISIESIKSDFRLISSFYARASRDLVFKSRALWGGQRVKFPAISKKAGLRHNFPALFKLKKSGLARNSLLPRFFKLAKNTGSSFSFAFNENPRFKIRQFDSLNPKSPKRLRLLNRVFGFRFKRKLSLKFFLSRNRKLFSAPDRFLYGVRAPVKRAFRLSWPSLRFATFNLRAKESGNLSSFRDIESAVLLKNSPRTRSRKPKFLHFSPFNRLWQKIYLNGFFKALSFHAPFNRNVFFNRFRRFFYAGLNLPILKSKDAATRLIFFNLAFILIHAGLSPSYWFSCFLIQSGWVYVNSKPIYNPLFQVRAFDLIKLSPPVALFLSLVFIVRKFNSKTLASPKKFTFFKRYQPPAFLEVSFKLFEIKILKTFAANELKLPFAGHQSNFGDLMYQRFFPKQRRFGLGRVV
jgi:hypothetical protein